MKKSKGKIKEVKQMFIDGEVTATEAAKLTGLSPNAFYTHRHTHRIKLKSKNIEPWIRGENPLVNDKPLGSNIREADEGYEGIEIAYKGPPEETSDKHDEYTKLNRKYTKLKEFVLELLND
jgi:hypothetical protein